MVQTVAVIGTGLIGASWAALFLAKGLDVYASDPGPGAEERLRADIARHWPVLQTLGLASNASYDRLKFSANAAEAVRHADFVQENVPERLDIKAALLETIEPALREHAIVASSSSALLISDIQTYSMRPDKLVMGHPFNPPHLIPLVEISGGAYATEHVVQKAVAFYESIGQKPVVLKREVKGHIANRIQAALWREAFHLVESGVATTQDIDTAIAYGPGLRWALLGPFLNLALSGGKGGIRHTFEHLGPAMESMWSDLGTISSLPELFQKLAADVEEGLGDTTLDELLNKRDGVLADLLIEKRRAMLP